MKKLLCLIPLLGLAIAVNSQLTNNIVAYWKLDGNANDAAGSNTGTVIGATADPLGKISSAYSFDGTNDYVSVPNSTSLNIQSNTITLSAWVYPTANKHSVVVSKIHNTGTHVTPYFQYTLQFYYVASPTPRIYPRFGLSIGGIFRIAANTSLAITLNQWHHFVGVYNGSTMKLYMDGSEVISATQTGNIDSYNTPVYISEIGSLDGSEVFQGRIDEIGIWSRALSVGEVSSLYNSGSGLSFPFGTTSAPSVTTTSASTIAQTTATSGGNVTADGGATVTARGVCWSTSSNPTIALTTKTSNGTGTGTFTSSITGLTAGTTYHVRAYATNSIGTSYGSDVSFTTTTSGSTTWLINGSNIYYNGGNVGIGTSAPTSALTVNGEILAREVEVVSSITSDFVFEQEYKLMPLTELEIYLKQHRHLPGIPSVAEFSRTGQDLGKMDDLLLRKIEELTLYIVELKKEIDRLKECK